MKFQELEIPGLFLIEANVFEDERGAFRRHFCLNEFKQLPDGFEVKQANMSENFKKHTLRGFHFQAPPYGEDKVLTPITGAIYNITVDLRPDSKTFKKWFPIELKAGDRRSLHVPKGCANAFLTLEDTTTVHYYMSEFYSPDNYYGFRYNDPAFGVTWPNEPAVISDKDAGFADFDIEQYIKDVS